MKRIVVATDGSPGGRLAVARGISLARETGAELTFVNVLQHASATDAVTGQGPRQPGSRTNRAAVEEAVAEATSVGVKADYQFLEGDPADAAVDFARERDAELIVVGSRGLGRLRGRLLGSVSHAIVNDADRAVLVVKEQEEHPGEG